MGKTNIEWTETPGLNDVSHKGYTFNPWIGCTHKSPGCIHCYAETLLDHRFKTVEWGKGKPRNKTSISNWKKPITWNKKASSLGVRFKVFCASLADVFDAEVADEWRSELWDLIDSTRELDWLLLTKRIENVKTMVPDKWMDGGWPSHVWLGTSVEDQQRADERVDLLLEHPAPVRFLSCEPLIGPLNIPRISELEWVICGGESGKEARAMLPSWAIQLRNDCLRANTPFFFKQWGEWGPDPMDPTGQRMVKAGKSKTGSSIDGNEYKQYPIIKKL